MAIGQEERWSEDGREETVQCVFVCACVFVCLCVCVGRRSERAVVTGRDGDGGDSLERQQTQSGAK